MDWRKSSHSSYNGNCVEASAAWRKSSHSHSQSNCVEASAAWHTSSYSNQTNCVQVATPAMVLVRDSKNPGPVLAFTRAQWAAFTTALKGR